MSTYTAPLSQSFKTSDNVNSYINYNATILGTSGLVHYYTLDNSNANIVVNDLVGSLNGQSYGNIIPLSAPLVNDNTNTAYFNGNSFVYFASPWVNGKTTQTYEFWVGGYQSNITQFFISDGFGGYGLDIYVDSSNYIHVVLAENDINTYTVLPQDCVFDSNGNLISFNAHHFVFTSDGVSNSTLYLDNNVIFSQNIVPLPCYGASTLMKQSAGPAAGAQGYIDKIAIYNIVLTPSQISHHYQIGLISNNLRISQEVLEITSTNAASSNLRISQEVLEITSTNAASSNLRVSQELLEIVNKNSNSNLKISQFIIEYLVRKAKYFYFFENFNFSDNVINYVIHPNQVIDVTGSSLHNPTYNVSTLYNSPRFPLNGGIISSGVSLGRISLVNNEISNNLFPTGEYLFYTKNGSAWYKYKSYTSDWSQEKLLAIGAGNGINDISVQFDLNGYPVIAYCNNYKQVGIISFDINGNMNIYETNYFGSSPCTIVNTTETILIFIPQFYGGSLDFVSSRDNFSQVYGYEINIPGVLNSFTLKQINNTDYIYSFSTYNNGQNQVYVATTLSDIHLFREHVTEYIPEFDFPNNYTKRISNRQDSFNFNDTINFYRIFGKFETLYFSDFYKKQFYGSRFDNESLNTIDNLIGQTNYFRQPLVETFVISDTQTRKLIHNVNISQNLVTSDFNSRIITNNRNNSDTSTFSDSNQDLLPLLQTITNNILLGINYVSIGISRNIPQTYTINDSGNRSVTYNRLVSESLNLFSDSNNRNSNNNRYPSDSLIGSNLVNKNAIYHVKYTDTLSFSGSLTDTYYQHPSIGTTNLPNGEIGASYSVNLNISGGTGSLTFNTTSGTLPSGLSYSGNYIIGTPTGSPGTYNFTITVTDSLGLVGSYSYNNLVIYGTPSVAATLPVGTVGLSYTGAYVTASGGSGSYSSYGVSPSLSSYGLTLNSSTGQITGTPSASANTAFTFSVYDGYQTVYSSPTYLTINPITITTTSLSNADDGLSYNQPLVSSLGAGNGTWSVISGTLPTGLSLSSSGTISGTPTGTTQTFTVQVSNGSASASKTFTLNVNPQLTITTSSLSGWDQNLPSYSQTLTSTGGNGGNSWSYSGSLPAGLSLSGSTILGTPTGTGTSTFTVEVTDSLGQTATKSLSININSQLTITTSTLSNGTAGTSYSQVINTSGGNGSNSYGVISGSLPTGLSLSGNTISGTPTAQGVYNFIIQVTDSYGQSTTQSYSVTISLNVSYLVVAGGGGGSNGGGGGGQVLCGSLTVSPGISYNAIVGPGGALGSIGTNSNFNCIVVAQGGGSGSTSGGSSGSGYSGGTGATSTGGYGGGGGGGQTGSGSNGSSTYAPAHCEVVHTGACYCVIHVCSIGSSTGGNGGSGICSSITGTAVGYAGGGGGYATNSANCKTITQGNGTNGGGNGGNAGAANTGGGAGGNSTGGSGIVVISYPNTYPAAASSSVSPICFSGNRIYKFTTSGSIKFANVVSAGPVITTSSLPNQTAGISYNQTISSTGGTTPYTYSVISGSSSLSSVGLSLSSSGLLSGTPSAGSASFTVQVTDNNSLTNSKTYNITIYPVVSITKSSLPNTTAGIYYNQQITTSGGNGLLTFSVISGSLPAGLSLNSSTGIISGTATTATSYSFTIKAQDSNGSYATQAYSITVSAGLVITKTSLPNGDIGLNYNQTISSTGGYGTVTYSVISGTLPTGITLYSNGAFNGTPTGSGASYSFVIQAQDSNNAVGSQAYSMTINNQLAVSTTSLSNWDQNLPSYNQTLISTGGNGGNSWSIISGSLPTGLNLSGATISGTPTGTGTSSFTVKVIDNLGQSATQSLNITINSPVSISASYPNGVVTVVATCSPYRSYNYTPSSGGGNGGNVWSIVCGSVPPGLTFYSCSGALIGNPSTAGNYNFKVKVQDNLNQNAISGTQNVTIVPANYNVGYLIVGGGGGGGASSCARSGGGGGAGELAYGCGGSGTGKASLSMVPGNTYYITVGAGGAGGSGTGSHTAGSNGCSSTIGCFPGIGYFTVKGGGGGGGTCSVNGGNTCGGSGGGGASSNTAGSGGGGGECGRSFTCVQHVFSNNGGNGASYNGLGYGGSGGGGGAGGVGGSPSGSSFYQGGYGGSGRTYNITGSCVVYAGGGGGGARSSSGGSGGSGGGGAGGNGCGFYAYGGTAGTNGLGGGGGGAGAARCQVVGSCSTGYSTEAGSGANGGKGGNGVVILSIPTANYTGIYSGSCVSVTTNGSNTVLIYKSSGSYKA